MPDFVFYCVPAVEFEVAIKTVGRFPEIAPLRRLPWHISSTRWICTLTHRFKR